MSPEVRWMTENGVYAQQYFLSRVLRRENLYEHRDSAIEELPPCGSSIRRVDTGSSTPDYGLRPLSAEEVDFMLVWEWDVDGKLIAKREMRLQRLRYSYRCKREAFRQMCHKLLKRVWLGRLCDETSRTSPYPSHSEDFEYEDTE
jgi:hypothetical protein